MPVFKFRLQSIFDLRVHIENEQKDIYAAENVRLSELDVKREKLGQKFDQWSLKYMNEAESGINATDASQIHNYLDDLKELIRRTDKQIEVQQQVVENERLNLIEKMKDRKTLENLKDRQHKFFCEAIQKKDEKEIEETLIANLPRLD
jgi:flagellar FliJ protein